MDGGADSDIGSRDTDDTNTCSMSSENSTAGSAEHDAAAVTAGHAADDQGGALTTPAGAGVIALAPNHAADVPRGAARAAVPGLAAAGDSSGAGGNAAAVPPPVYIEGTFIADTGERVAEISGRRFHPKNLSAARQHVEKLRRKAEERHTRGGPAPSPPAAAAGGWSAAASAPPCPPRP